MGKSVHPDVLDGALAVVRDNATQMVALNGEPRSYAAAVSGALASATMDSAAFTLAAGATAGRGLLVSAQTDIAVTGRGTAAPVALLDAAKSRRSYVTTVAPQALPSGGTVSLPGRGKQI